VGRLSRKIRGERWRSTDLLEAINQDLTDDARKEIARIRRPQPKTFPPTNAYHEAGLSDPALVGEAVQRVEQRFPGGWTHRSSTRWATSWKSTP
jgi:hypothetical protein